MKLENTFSIPVQVDEAWRVLLDVERIAPCVPGATLTSSEGDTHRGKVKVKLGPIGLTYNGTVKFLEQDAAAKVVVLEASGREMRGNGTATAQVTCRLVASGDATDVFVETELAITGKPAQFGRGALALRTSVVRPDLLARIEPDAAAALPPLAPGDRYRPLTFVRGLVFQYDPSQALYGRDPEIGWLVASSMTGKVLARGGPSRPGAVPVGSSVLPVADAPAP